MSSTNGDMYGFTGLFPIKRNADCDDLRSHLRQLDEHPQGSPLSKVALIHMARLVIVDRLPFQGTPAALDQLRTPYLLFACEFNGASVETLVRALVERIPDEVSAIWRHCIGFPGVLPIIPSDPDDIAQYFRRCQIETNLFLADQPDRTVPQILRALRAKQRLTAFLEQHQGEPPMTLQRSFHDMWRRLVNEAEPEPGSL